ncbi:MAG TPA: fibronectin type III domain-containing protein [Anaerolineae bacterium]|nr:fibronectin type III domain-containing protein [Anaerolineae bacterium]
MNADGSNQIQLTTQEYCEGPVWSPDGTKIAYDAAGSDYWQNLWIVNADGSNPHVVFDEGGYADAWARSWSPDGRYIAFTRIYYTIYNNQLYWTNAYLDALDSTTSNVVRLSNNGLDWRPDWQSTDIAAPSSAVSALRTVSPGPFTVRWSGTDSGSSGLKNFDIQIKDGVNGTWTTWQSQTTATSAYYPGVGGHTYYFRSRARDNSGNVENWPASYDATTTVEALAPVSAVEALPQFTKNTVTVTWSGNDPGGSGIQAYDVQYQDVTAGGSWTAWQISVTTTSSVFIGTTGHTYAFRARAIDRAHNQEDWPAGSGEAQTTFYAWNISGIAYTNAGSPVVGVNVATQPNAQGVFAADLSGAYAAYVITTSNTYTVSWAKPGYGNLPATTFKDSPHTPITYRGTLSAQGDVVTIDGLSVGQTYRIVISGTFAYSGGGGALADAQWGITGNCTPGVFCYYSRNVRFNGILLAAENGQTVVDPNHQYTFLWTANSSQLQMQISDSTYSDNTGSLDFEFFPNPSGTTSLYRGILSAQGTAVTLGGFQINQTYRIVISGTYEYSIGGGALADAQWAIAGYCTPGVFCHYAPGISFNGILLAAQNGQSAVDPNHEYTFLWTADTSQLQLHIMDSNYSDNSGYLTFEIFSDEDASNSFSIFLPPADDLISNGHFEHGDESIDDWIMSGTPTPTVTTTVKHTGQQSIVLGSPSVTSTMNLAIAQAVNIPLTMTTPILSFLYQKESSSLHEVKSINARFAKSDAPDPDTSYQSDPELSTVQQNNFAVTVNDGITDTVVFVAALNASDWTHQWFDFSAWKGQTITVTFSLHQNAAGQPAWAYLDEVSLGSGHPDVWVQLANPPIARPGSTVVYQLNYGNQGGALASNVQLTATLPAQLTFVTASVPPSSTTSSLVWNLGDLPAQNGPNTILITATVTPTITGVTVVSSTVDIATTAAELEMANNTQQTSMTIKYNVFLPIVTLE